VRQTERERERERLVRDNHGVNIRALLTTARSNNEASPSTIGHGLELKISSASLSFSCEARRRPSDEYQPEVSYDSLSK